jgi:hypothetical protein
MVTDERRTVLEVLYPWFKEEVFRRRTHMMRLTSLAVTLLLGLLAFATLSPRDPSRAPGVALFLIPGLVLFSALMAYLILQQRDRHRQAKQMLIDLERRLKLFEKEDSLSGNALYPAEWQTAWQQDASVVVYLSAIASMTALVIAALLAG